MDPVGLLYRDLKNIRPVGSEIAVFDWIHIPGAVGPGEYSPRLIELPLDIPLSPYSDPFEVVETDAYGTPLGNPPFTVIDQTGVLVPGSVQIKRNTNDADDTFVFAFIKFSQYDAGRYLKITYMGRGSLVWASDVTDVCKGLSLLPGVIRPGHISVNPTDDFFFPRDVNIEGDLNIKGIVNRSISEILETTDDIILINGEAVAPGADMGLEFGRGGLNPKFMWLEADDSFNFLGTSGADLLKIFDSDRSVTLSGIIRLKDFTTAQEAALVTVGNIGGVFRNSDDLQAKMIAADGLGGAKLVIMG